MQIVAHRGASAELPEQTLAAYELAIEQGADGLECDVRLTSDGQLVCVHDRTVNRTSNGNGPVAEHTLAELEALDFGTGAGVLTLASLLELVTAHPGLRLFVETKHPVRTGGLVETALAELLAKFGLRTKESPITLMSFSITAMRRISLLTPELPAVLLLDTITARRPLPGWIDIAGPGIATLRADPDYVSRCPRPVYCWTVDDPEEVRKCAEMGVEYLATNTPAVARKSRTP